jgi:hypothetical protein
MAALHSHTPSPFPHQINMLFYLQSFFPFPKVKYEKLDILSKTRLQMRLQLKTAKEKRRE